MLLPLNNHVTVLELSLVPILTFNFVVDTELMKDTGSELVDTCTLDGLQSHNFRAGAFQCFQTFLIDNNMVKSPLSAMNTICFFSLSFNACFLAATPGAVSRIIPFCVGVLLHPPCLSCTVPKAQKFKWV
jgi:hypothetical protein